MSDQLAGGCDACSDTESVTEGAHCGEDLFNAVCVSGHPTSCVEQLSDVELKNLKIYVDGLAESGIPLLVSALVDEECAERFFYPV